MIFANISNLLKVPGELKEYKELFKETADSAKVLKIMEGELNDTTVNFIKTFKNGEVSLKGFLTSTTGITLGITSLVGVMYALHKIFPSITKATSELKENIESFNAIKEEVTDLSSELDTCKERLEELQELGGLRTIVEDEELEKLQKTTVEYERQLAIKKENLKLSAKEALDTANKAFNGRFRSQYSNEGNDIIGDSPELNNGANNPAEELHNAILNYNKNKEAYDDAVKNMLLFEKDRNISKDAETKYQYYKKEADALEKAMISARDRAAEMYDTTSSISSAYEKLEYAGEKITDSQHKQYLITKEADNEYTSFCQSLDETASKYEKLSSVEQRNALQRKLMQVGKNSKEAQNIANSISEDKLQYASKIIVDENSSLDSINKSIEEIINEGQNDFFH